MIIASFFIGHWYASLFSQTFFLHRYSAHQMFTMSKFWERVFYMFTYISQGSSYLSAHAYGALHRLHHAFTDTEKDPHSPMYDENPFAMMWRTKKIYSQILDRKLKIDPSFLKNLPHWKFIERLGSNWISRIGWGSGYFFFYYFFAGDNYWLYLLLPIHFVMGPVHGVIINWCAHKYGYTNFEIKDTSKNFLFFDFLMMGESYHNNHHKYGSRPNFGFKWHELDPTYFIIKVFAWFKIIRLKKKLNLSQYIKPF